MVESCPNIYNRHKLEENINKRLAMISFTPSTKVEWAEMLRMTNSHNSQPNPLQDPTNYGAVPPNVGDPMDTEAE